MKKADPVKTLEGGFGSSRRVPEWSGGRRSAAPAVNSIAWSIDLYTLFNTRFGARAGMQHKSRASRISAIAFPGESGTLGLSHALFARPL
jgi:hypothetical protein